MSMTMVDAVRKKGIIAITGRHKSSVLSKEGVIRILHEMSQEYHILVHLVSALNRTGIAVSLGRSGHAKSRRLVDHLQVVVWDFLMPLVAEESLLGHRMARFPWTGVVHMVETLCLIYQREEPSLRCSSLPC
jgi:hypothetical protein